MADPVQTITPHLVVNDANAAIEFYKKALGATEVVRMPAQDGKRLMHCEMHFAGNAIYFADNMMDAKGPPAMVSVFIGFDKAADVDALTAKAKTMGAAIIQEPQDMFWGDRFAMFTDPFGHSWQVGASKGS